MKEKLKARISEAFRLYFILVTLITILLMVLGLTLDSDRTFSYEAFMSPLIYAAIGVVPCLIFNGDKELSMKRLIIKRVASLLITETVILVIAFSASNIPTEKKGVVIGIAVGIAVVFALSIFIEYLFELAGAKDLNEALKRFQGDSEK